MKREVLVLYDGGRAQSAMENVVAAMGQTILNHYGILPEYRDVRQRPLPDDRAMDRFRAVITTFTIGLQEGLGDYLAWLKRQTAAGRRIVILGDPGASIEHLEGSPEGELLREIFRYLGLSAEGDATQSKVLIRYAYKDGQGVEFERKYPLFPESYEKYRPVHEDVKTYLSVKRTDKEDSESSLIVTSPRGGFADGDCIYWEDPVTYAKKWYLNPFLFFREALGLEGLPAPDPTTLNGLRVAISHVDADGFPGLSRIDKKSTCAEMMRDRIFKKYEFPITASVIAGEIDPEAMGNEKVVRLAREIFALPNVESASHSYSHPFFWDPEYFFKNRYASQYGIAIPGYAFDPAMEIDYSIKYITEHLAPPGRPCRVILWSGNCEPMEAHIARCDAIGVLNMNGGDTVYDDVSNSYTSVAPYYRKVGERVQVFTGQANDNILTNLWKGPYFGYRGIITTMQRTDNPRRMAPIDIYYHFFSAEYPASLKALEEVYEWALKQDTARMFTSEYIPMVLDYLGVRIFREDRGRYAIENYGRCLTVRFDGEQGIPDLSRCENVLGFSEDPQGLYVSLAPGKGRAVIALSDRSSPPENRPHIKRAGGWVDNFRVEDRSLRFRYRGFGRGKIQMAGVKPLTGHHIRGSALTEKDLFVESDGRGILSLSPEKNGTLEITWK